MIELHLSPRQRKLGHIKMKNKHPELQSLRKWKNKPEK